MVAYTLYVVDDDEFIREGVRMALETNYRVETFLSAEEALSALQACPPDLVLLDIGLPGMDGIEALQAMRTRCPDVLILMITAFEETETVIAAMRLGAYDYVVKPIHMDALEVSIRNALQTIRLRKEVQSLQEQCLRESIPCFIGESRRIQDVMETVHAVAKSPDTTVLILGETGTGKELIASTIHYKGPSFNGPFVTVNCAAIPRDLIESELFGYEPGAFSGARASGKRGLIDEAAHGTLFLDEIGDMSLEAQAKLLRFLEGGEYYRVGGTKRLNVKTRVVSATNKDITAMVKEGRFRDDLYYRLSVITIRLPSLNERREDILPLARHFLVEFGRKFGKAFHGISSEAEEVLGRFLWQGNIRELRNMMERGALIGKEPELDLKDLGLERLQPDVAMERTVSSASFPPLPREGMDLIAMQDDMERFYITEALKRSGGNESGAARLLHLNHHTFRYRKKRLQIL